MTCLDVWMPAFGVEWMVWPWPSLSQGFYSARYIRCGIWSSLLLLVTCAPHDGPAQPQTGRNPGCQEEWYPCGNCCVLAGQPMAVIGQPTLVLGSPTAVEVDGAKL